MTKETTIKIIIALTLVLIPGISFSWDSYDDVVAVVNSEPIVESEINERFDIVRKQKKISKRKFKYEKSRILDQFIEDALVKETAYDESIIISDIRVLSHLEKVIQQYLAQESKDEKEVKTLAPKLSKRLSGRLEKKTLTKNEKLDKKLDDFIAFIEKNQKMTFKQYFEEIRRQMRRDQVMSIAIGIAPPSIEEAMKWYNRNKKKLGYEVNVKHILIKPKGKSFKAEREANNELSNIRKQIIAGKSFEAMAKAHSQDPGSAKNGGNLGWVMLAELDPYFANFVYQMKRKGQISQVFKSGFGYHIVKYLGRRPVTFNKVKKMIMFKLYNENMQKQFNKWVIERKKMSDIKIYFKDYIKNKKS